MAAEDSSFSFCVVQPDNPSWGPARSPNLANNSPLSDFYSDGFSDVEAGVIFNHPFDGSPTIPVHELTASSPSTALIHELGNVDLGGHRDRGGNVNVPVSTTSAIGRKNVLLKAESPSHNDWDALSSPGAWGSGNSGYPSILGIKTASGRTYRPGNELSPIDTQCISPGFVNTQPLSGFSDHSTINSTSTINSCSPTKNRGRDLWASDPYPYPESVLCEKRSTSFSSSHPSGYPNRKRSLSDTRLPSGNSGSQAQFLPNLTPSDSCFLGVPGQGRFAQAYPWEPSHKSLSQSSVDYASTSGSGATVLSADKHYVPNPTFVYHHPQALPRSPVQDARTGQGLSTLGTHAHYSFKQTVASEAVVKAAQKKRRNHDGKMFDCHICQAQLTTKQNLQYHVAAHLGERKFTCRKCSKPFTTPHVRNRHEQRCKK
ncbi:Zinc finger and BTB domain-containing protein 24 [Leucoagaricus sp. SymC.cos]|nr:Zinc finger and BTB domain-containing protein 24 [Leucoagaricus sp. SymC.cos]